MSADICDWSDLEKSMCAHCRGLTLHDPEPVVLYTFTAQHPGVCANCHTTFDVGTEIGKTDDGTYVHEECP